MHGYGHHFFKISNSVNCFPGWFQVSSIIRDKDEVQEFADEHGLQESTELKKILLIETKLWFKRPLNFHHYSNNGFVQTFTKANIPRKTIRKIIQASHKVCEFVGLVNLFFFFFFNSVKTRIFTSHSANTTIQR